MTAATPVEDEIVALLAAQRAGDEKARRTLFSLLYEELRRLAAAQMGGERAGHTLAPTSLVHEVYLRLEKAPFSCHDREEFLRLAALVMRRTLIDSARRREARRRALCETRPGAGQNGEADRTVLLVDAALSALARVDPELARVVELRFLLGLDLERSAAALGVSVPTVKRRWRTARAFLAREIAREPGHGP